MNEIVIHTNNLSKQFDNIGGVQDVSFEIQKGSIFGFIGPSGCGKTTTVRLLTGLYQPTSGEAIVLGEQPQALKLDTGMRIGYMPQLFVLYEDLSVWENLSFTASLYGVGLRRKQRLTELLEFVELIEHKRKLVRNLSGGMRRRLSLAATLVHNPELLFLDEPTGGIDPVLRHKFWDHFKSLQEQGHTLFITTQYIGEAAYCDYIGILIDGRLLTVDTPEGLRQRAYGGEIVELRTSEFLRPNLLSQLRNLPCVEGDVTRSDQNKLRIVVDDAGKAMPTIMDWCHQQQVEVESIEEYLPPFDDVFVKLVRDNGQDH